MTTDTWIGAAALLAAGTITPGPNNLIVMSASARSGLKGSIPAIAGVVLGGLALIALVVMGAGAVFAAEPVLRWVTAAAGCAYMLWLGCQLIAQSLRVRAFVGLDATQGLPSSVLGIAVFQFFNPKGWVMVLTVVSTTGALHLILLFAVISPACLLVWGALGSLLAAQLARRRMKAWFDRGMGALLLGSSWLLVRPTLLDMKEALSP